MPYSALLSEYNWYRDYNASQGRYLQSDPTGLDGGINTYAYTASSPLENGDPTGLTPGEWNGPGNTAMCAYYEEMARAHPKCSYYKEAANTCRGGNKLVSLAVNLGIRNAWSTNSTNASEAAILESIRSGLIAADKRAREAGKVDCNTDCVFGNDIDDYHDDVFRATGIDTNFYGGNLWNQGVYPNYVPKDPRGARNPPPLYSPWYRP